MPFEQATLTQQPERTAAGGIVPPLKWAGGKRWLVPHLQSLWVGNEHRRLVEPFAGGLSVALGLMPKKALLNDINPHVINFYRHLKAGLTLDMNGGTSERTYYSHRGAFNELIRQGRAVGMHDDGRRAAMLFYYLNRHCYNGLCRFNRKGEFNTPQGDYVKPKFQKDLREYAPVLQEWDFTIGDFADMDYQKSDFVYADPPYDDAFTGYSKGGFGYADQKRLAERLAAHPGPVVLSNHATDDMLGLYRELGFDVSRRFDAPRMIHCFGDRTPAQEVVAVRNIGRHGR
jgi:DNA adenine methylase